MPVTSLTRRRLRTRGDQSAASVMGLSADSHLWKFDSDGVSLDELRASSEPALILRNIAAKVSPSSNTDFSTAQGTKLWVSDGESGPQIHDELADHQWTAMSIDVI